MKIPKKRVRALPLRARVAWAAAIVERVLDVYSDYVVKKYELNKPLALAWKFAEDGRIDTKASAALTQRIGERVEEADLEGYGFQFMAMGVEILEEIRIGRGENAIVAIENAARAFAVHQLYQQGLSDGDPRVPLPYAESLEDPVYRAAIEALAIAEACGARPPARKMFTDIRLDVTFEALPKKHLQKSAGAYLKPPKHEVAR